MSPSRVKLWRRRRPPTNYRRTSPKSNEQRFRVFFHAMLEQGIYLAPSCYEAAFVSLAHGDAELDATLAAAERALRLAAAVR